MDFIDCEVSRRLAKQATQTRDSDRLGRQNDTAIILYDKLNPVSRLEVEMPPDNLRNGGLAFAGNCGARQNSLPLVRKPTYHTCGAGLHNEMILHSLGRSGGTMLRAIEESSAS